MIRALYRFLGISLIFCSGTFAHAEEGLTPVYGGSGCKQGTVSVKPSADGKTLNIVFDQFVVEAGKIVEADHVRKFCDLVVPLHVPAGYALGVTKLESRGYAFVPRGGSGKMETEYFLKSSAPNSLRRSRRVKSSKTILGRTDADVVLTPGGEGPLWSPCGQSVSLRVSSGLEAHSNSKGEDTLLSLDGASASLAYQLEWRRCK